MKYTSVGLILSICRANSRDTIPIRPATNQVLCPQIRRQSLIVDVASRANGKDEHYVLSSI
jgi:hypothetical protein